MSLHRLQGRRLGTVPAATKCPPPALFGRRVASKAGGSPGVTPAVAPSVEVTAAAHVSKSSSASSAGPSSSQGVVATVACRRDAPVSLDRSQASKRDALAAGSTQHSKVTALEVYQRDGNVIIAREIALDISKGVYSPVVVEHISGISNISADALSRVFQPDTEISIPVHLRDVPRTKCDEDPHSLFPLIHRHPTLV